MTNGKNIAVTILAFVRNIVFHYNVISFFCLWASLVTQLVESAVWETGVQSLGKEDPLEKEMATPSSILAWRIPWTEEPGRLQSAECRRIDAFELWCWRRLLRVPWNARRSNQSILKEISPESSLEGMMLKLKLQYFGHLM